MPTIEPCGVGEADGTTRRVYQDIMRTYGLEEPRSIYQLMGHTPDHLAVSWERSRFLYGRDTVLTVAVKHLLTLAISAVHGCEYCCRSHTTRLQQLGFTSSDVLEVLALTAMAFGASKLPEDAIPQLPVPARGKLDRKVRAMIRYAATAIEGFDSRIQIAAAELREARVGEEELLELLFVIDLVSGYNRYVQGLQVDPWEGALRPWGQHAEANTAAPSVQAGRLESGLAGSAASRKQ